MNDIGAMRDGWPEAWRFRWPQFVARLINRLPLAASIRPVAAAVHGPDADLLAGLMLQPDQGRFDRPEEEDMDVRCRDHSDIIPAASPTRTVP